jgi:hypothetical protein
MGAPVAAVVGSLLTGPLMPIALGVGALIGYFGSRKKQNQRHVLEMQELSGIQKVLTAYNLGGADYNSAFSALEQMRQEYAQQFVKMGGKSHIGQQVNSHIDIAESQLAQQEAARQAKAMAAAAEQQRRAGMVFGPAQFRMGGFVGPLGVPLRFAMGGEVPAILHSGEFVMRPEAVRQQGVAKLEAMNDGRSGGGDMNIHITAWDGPSVDRWLNNGGVAKIQRAFAVARAEGRF